MRRVIECIRELMEGIEPNVTLVEVRPPRVDLEEHRGDSGEEAYVAESEVRTN